MTNLPPQNPAANVNYESANSFVDRDNEHLKILSICWYISAGLAALGGFFPLIYVVLGVLMATGKMTGGSGPGGPPPALFGGFMALFGGCFSLFIWLGAVLAFFTARSITRRRRIVLCYITAALACVQIPLGTALGVFTFIVLARPSVKASFANQ